MQQLIESMRSMSYDRLLDRKTSFIVGSAVSIASAKERIGTLLDRNPKSFSRMEEKAFLQSVMASNAIEGIYTSDERLRGIVGRTTEPRDHDEQAIAGYRDALEYILRECDSIEVSESTILELHRRVMSHTPEGGGQYKDRDNVIVETDVYGNRRIRFRPVSSEDTPWAMEQLILSYTAASQERVEPLLLIPCFILDFLCIHPFLDGNGRVSRLLTVLLFCKAGYHIVRYCSFEERIYRNLRRYYETISESNQGWHEGTNDYSSFLNYYLFVLDMCCKDAEGMFSTISEKRAIKKNRVESVVLKSLYPISKKEIMDVLPDISQTTVEACLHNMLKEGSIEKLGGNRNARYRKKRQ